MSRCHCLAVVERNQSHRVRAHRVGAQLDSSVIRAFACHRVIEHIYDMDTCIKYVIRLGELRNTFEAPNPFVL